MTYSRVKKDDIITWIKEVLYTPIEGEILNTPLDKLELSTRATNALNKTEIITISNFMQFGPEKLCRVKNVGKKTIHEIGNAIKELLLEEADINEAKIESKTGTSKATFEELIKTSFDENLLNIPIEELDLTVRAFNGLKSASLNTIKDIIDFGLDTLQRKRIKNLGRKSIVDIKKAILTIQTHPQSKNEMSFTEAIESILASVNPKHLNIIKARYGYDEGKRKTLEEIGNKLGITRERVRQILTKEIRRIKHPVKRKVLQTIIENIERLLLQYKGIISINDMAKDKYFASGTHKQLRFLMNLIIDIYEERYRIIRKHFLTSLNDDEIKVVNSTIREVVLKCRFPIDERVFIERIISSVGTISEYYLADHLLYKEHIEISKGNVLSPGRLSIPKRVTLLMRDIDKPMHFTEIAKLYRNYFGDSKIKTSDLERAIHTRIGDSRDFIIVGPGTFILRDRFPVPDNIEEIVRASKEILQDLKNISDTKYLVSELKKRKMNIGNLNAYSLKTILFEYPGFVGYRKFEIGIRELSDKYKRKPLNDLIYEILLLASKPMHSKAIWKETLKQRGFPEYAIGQQLADDPRFIRVVPATYTVAKNIAQYEEKQKIITDFTKEWINLKRNAISAFFISEVLKETSEFKDLSLGLVENVLATSPEFIRLPNGFYDLTCKGKG